MTRGDHLLEGEFVQGGGDVAEPLALGVHAVKLELGLDSSEPRYRSISPESRQLQHGHRRERRRRETRLRKLRRVVAADGAEVVVVVQEWVEIRWVVCHVR